MWWIYALLSALFASLTAIFAKVGVENVNSNLATAIRTVVTVSYTHLDVYKRQTQRMWQAKSMSCWRN